MTAQAEAAYPSRARAWWVVFILFTASIVSVIDRGILALVVDPVRHELNISQVQVSLLQGLSFGIFYAVVGLPLGLAADRLPRRRLLILGISVWSVATFLGGLAGNFTHLFAARLLVGLGEAALAPCAASMIGDMFPPGLRGRAISVYIMGQSFANGLAVMLTGFILKAVPEGAFSWLPWLDGLSPWRVVFLLAGVMGVPVVLALLTVSEPSRRIVGVVGAERMRVADVVRYLGRHKRLFIPLYLGFALVTVHVYGLQAWGPTYLLRHFSLTPAQVGAWQGSTVMIVGTLGAVIAGTLVDRMARGNVQGAKLLFLAGVASLMIPTTLMFLVPTPYETVLLLSVTSMLMPMIGTAMIATVQEVAPNRMRGIAVSLFGLFNTITGQTIGPLSIALLTERAFHDPMRLGEAIFYVCLPALLMAVVCYLLAFVAIRHRLRISTEFSGIVTSEAHR